MRGSGKTINPKDVGRSEKGVEVTTLLVVLGFTNRKVLKYSWVE